MGGRIPFANNNFDIALLLTILHHTPHPEAIINEAKRVAKKIIIIEDIYTNTLHRYSTYFFDSLVNLEFFGHPHTNKNDKEWRRTFDKLGLTLVAATYANSFLVFRQATYFLEVK